VVATTSDRRVADPAAWLSALPAAVGLAVLGVPTLIMLGREVWSTGIGAHGPIILATAAWLLWTRLPDLKSDGAPGAPWLTALGLTVSLALYAFGRPYEFTSLEVAGLYGACVSFLHARFGVRPLLRNWFPLLYLAFIIPPPGWVVDTVTAPLKEFVSYAATHILQVFGIPIIREGVTLTVGSYQLLVEDACSGMNSLIGLIAIGLFYIYLLRNASVAYSAFLLSMVIPIAIVANIVRIIVLVLLTYFAGDAVAQSFLHMTAGMFVFVVALLAVFGIDHLMSAVLSRRAKAA
jgi:exosortase